MLSSAEVAVHERVRRALDTKLSDRRFWLRIQITLPDRASAPTFDEDDMVSAVADWLEPVDPEGDPDRWPVLGYEEGDLELELQAYRKGEAFRSMAVPVVANPAPAFAYWT